MYQIDSLKRSLQEIAKLRGHMAEIDTQEHRDKLRKEFDGQSPYAGMFGEATAVTRWACNGADAALKALAALETLVAGVSVDTDIESRTKMPYWVLTVPAKVTLVCPLCGAANECDLHRDDDIDVRAEACYTADIDTDRCEDCNTHLCPHCPRFPLPDDADLIRCSKCVAGSVPTGPK